MKATGWEKKGKGGEAGERRSSDLTEANPTGFVKDDLITSSLVCWDLCLSSLSTVFDSFPFSLLFFAAFNLAANLIKLTITLCGETRAHIRGRGVVSRVITRVKEADSQHLPKARLCHRHREHLCCSTVLHRALQCNTPHSQLQRPCSAIGEWKKKGGSEVPLFPWQQVVSFHPAFRFLLPHSTSIEHTAALSCGASLIYSVKSWEEIYRSSSCAEAAY